MNIPSPYSRPVNYYETDRMSIVHHSNYIRWMEEARLDYMHKAGVDYPSMEADGIIMPVTGVKCSYKTSLRYGDTFTVKTTLTGFNGIRMEFSYKIYTDDPDTPCCVGESGHCFLGAVTRQPVSLRRHGLKYYEIGVNLLAAEQSAGKE
ncbi:MAG: acyl-CoA thioesterase [Oscillospiraceae bacterium]|nr:acyl-CoA thioesterase [Oscillospiraceae bacterium]